MTRLRTPHLIAIVALASLLVSAATVALVARANDGAREQREGDRVAVAESLAGALEVWHAGVRAAASTAAADAVASGGARPPSALPVPSAADGAYVVGQDGVVVHASGSRAALLGLERRERVVLAGREQVSGPRIVIDGFTRQPEVTVAAPLGDGDTYVSVQAATESALLAMLDAAGLPDGVSLAVTDPDGRVYRPGPLPESLELLGPDVAPAASRATDGSGIRTYAGQGELPTVGAWAPFGDGWAVVLTEDAAAFGAGFWRPALAAVLPAILLAAIATWLTAMLLRAREEAERTAEQTKRAVLAVTGHELRTPMTVMKGMLSMLERRGEALTPDKRTELVDIVATQARKLEYLLERLISVGHLAAGQKLGVSLRAADITKAIDRAVEQQRGLSPLHDFGVELPDEPIRAEVDSKVLEDTLLHLLDNAVRYSPGGGEVLVSVNPNGRRVEIAVEDRGIGLPADRSRIFDAFQQGQAVDTRVEDEGGVGMGLFIVSQAMREMGGSVRAEDREGGGARFVLTVRRED